MTIVKIVANLATGDVQGLAAFYSDFLGLNVLMDQGWIVTLGGDELGPIQLSIASQGRRGAVVPDLSVQVDNVDEMYIRARDLGYEISYPLTDEDWGVRRFFVTDPMGRAINILAHI